MPKLGPKVVWECDVCGREAEAYEGEMPVDGCLGPWEEVSCKRGRWIVCAECYDRILGAIRSSTMFVLDGMEAIKILEWLHLETMRDLLKFCILSPEGHPSFNLAPFEGIHGDWVVRRRTEDDKPAGEESDSCPTESAVAGESAG